MVRFRGFAFWEYGFSHTEPTELAESLYRLFKNSEISAGSSEAGVRYSSHPEPKKLTQEKFIRNAGYALRVADMFFGLLQGQHTTRNP
jgi:hypothetical protein